MMFNKVKKKKQESEETINKDDKQGLAMLDLLVFLFSSTQPSLEFVLHSLLC